VCNNYIRKETKILGAMLQERPGHSGLKNSLTNFFKTSIFSVIQKDRLKLPVAFLRHLTDYKDSADVVRKQKQ